jgi:uncharacterized protein YfaS (alpha-2-macroglobulin family)
MAGSLRLLFAVTAIALAGCIGGSRHTAPIEDFVPYIHVYTGGMISPASAIRIELAQEQPSAVPGTLLTESPFRFSPALKGKTYWRDHRTLEFVPDEGALRAGQVYEGRFRLGDFVAVAPRLQMFTFAFRVTKPAMLMSVEPLLVTADRPDEVSVAGVLSFNIDVSKEEAGQTLSADDDKGTSYPATLTPLDDGRRYRFVIDGVPRRTDDYTLRIVGSGRPLNADDEKKVEATIPAKERFRFLSARRIDRPENGLEVTFSDPVSTTQDLKGLIDVPELSATIYQVKDNKVNLYFETGKTGKLTLRVDGGVKSVRGTALGTAQSLTFEAVDVMPQVKLLTEAAILPDASHLVLPFSAVGLRAVDLSVVHIYADNVPTFLQANKPDGDYELRRSGRLVHKKTLWLSDDPARNLHEWETYSVDLGDVMRRERGAVYRIYLSFRQEYSVYACAGSAAPTASPRNGEGLKQTADNAIGDDEAAAWDEPQPYYSYNPMGDIDWSVYDWRQRDNPCHPSYYMQSGRAAVCNVMASNVGVVVKRNAQNKLWVAVTNLTTAKPQGGAAVTVYNYQLQPMRTATTDSDGLAMITADGKPFLVVAEAGGQKAYVRVVDGEEQSVSRFDVGGKEVVKGLKGFIYGERGVWRPGDTLHLSFILEDRERRIPDRHPVTLEAYNPQGQFYNKLTSTTSTNGFYLFDLPTRADDPTGTWNLYVKVGGSSFHKSVPIETIKPNRLKIALTLPADRVQAGPATLPVSLTSSWLTGAVADRLKARVEVTLSKVNTQFKEYARYTFNNPTTDFSATRDQVFDGTLDVAGQVRFDWKLPTPATAPGMLNALFTARVFEPGGDASIYTQTVSFSPFSAYVGVDLTMPDSDTYFETDKDQQFGVVTLSPDGKPLDRTLEYKVYSVDWSWWWDHRGESMGAYVNNSSVKPVASGTLQSRGGKAAVPFRVNYPDWGRYLVYVKDVESGHAAGGVVYMDWPDWRGRAGRGDPDGVKMLSFSLDKAAYEAGDCATAIIPAAAGGRALVSIENGSTVLRTEWVTVNDAGDTKYTFDITPDMAPNVYLHITLLQPAMQTVNDLPMRLYGVMPVFVTNRQTQLQPVIAMPDVLRPETDFDITVGEQHGKPMTYTLAVVDDGLLDLTNFKTPDPWSEFYAREALGIRTWDMYDDVLGTTAGRLGSMFSTGGDETLKPADDKANRFKPVVRFIGPFTLKKGAKQTHRLRLPMYVGSVRAMVVAGMDGAYGSAEKNAFVRTPLMLLSTLPRVLSVGEEILVPVNVFAMEQGVNRASVSIETDAAFARVVGAAQQAVTFSQPGDQMVYFRLKTGSRTGKTTVKLTAAAGSLRAHETVEIEVRNPNLPVTLRSTQWIEAGQTAALVYPAAGAAQGSGSTVLEVSRIPTVDITRRLDFLYNYRYNCTEQLTSKALPLLYVDRFKALDEAEQASVKTNVEEGIRQLYGRQLPTGGFVYWPGDAVADEWITSYAGMFLVLAAENGYAVNADVLARWKRFQRNAAQSWRAPALTKRTLQSFLLQAFRLYTLALAATPEQGAMNRMKEIADLPPASRWTLAAAYAIAGKPDAASELVYQTPAAAPAYERGLFVDYSYGSSMRDNALILQALLRMNREQEAVGLAKTLSAQLSAEAAFTSQSTAFALMAMGELAAKLSGTLDFAWAVNGQQQPEVKSAKALFTRTLPVPDARGGGTLQVTNRGSGGISADIVTRLQPLNDTLPARSGGSVNLRVEYLTTAGAPLDVTTLKQGTDFLARISVYTFHPSESYPHMALTYILPSGWEVSGERPIGEPTAEAEYTYRDIRDDRVLTYFMLDAAQNKTYTFRLTATYVGSFVLPAVQCEEMYDASVYARTAAGRITVTE